MYMISLYFCTHSSSKLAKDNESDTFRMRIQRIQHEIAPVYFEAAEKLGRLLAKQHIRLINGAGSIGLMRSVADAVLKNGGEVTGVIPTSWSNRTGITQG